MVGEDTVQMSVTELKRVHVIRQVMNKALRQREAGEVLGLTTRQIRRLIQRVRAEGDAGLVHRSRGTPSNRQYRPALKALALRLYVKHYRDFGPTLAAEKLAERHGITLSAETVRGWLRAAGVTHFQRRTRPHRAWRARKAHRGELVQLDGSHHDWFEGRGPQCVLMAYIDDASSQVFARFYAYEGTIPAMDSFERYVRRYGVPHSVYTDNHTTYRALGEPTVAQQLAGEKPQSQFERALAELGVTVIHAHSPQAKGRVERLFKTLQDRLVKDLRLAGRSTIEAANQFVETWLPRYNRRFAVPPTQPVDLHRPCPARRDLDRSLCLKTTRVLRRDWTVAHHGQLYQICDNIRATQVQVEERIDGTMRITHHGQPLTYQAIAARPVRVRALTPPAAPRRSVKPKLTHPWHRRVLPDRHKAVATSMT
jgi:transposase